MGSCLAAVRRKMLLCWAPQLLHATALDWLMQKGSCHSTVR